MTIKPETLKALRAHFGLSQDELAYKSGVAKKTIGDIELGKRKKANTNTTKQLAKALKVEPADLAKDFGEIDMSQSKRDRIPGYRKISESIPADAHLSFDMVEHIYGVSRRTQIEMAPLLMALAAEASLNWRREKLNVITEATSALSAIAEGHLSFANAANRIGEGAKAEEDSINNRDLFGHTSAEAAYDLGYDPDTHNPFADYLRDFSSQNSSENISLDPDEPWINANGMPDYRIGSRIIEALTDGDQWARYTLSHGIVRIQDIPKELMTKEKRDERMKWLADKVPPENRKRIENEGNKLLGSLGL
jgi:transcriptional regulator with XRE-family HTH domain